jgi:hypothetical protein
VAVAPSPPGHPSIMANLSQMTEVNQGVRAHTKQEFGRTAFPNRSFGDKSKKVGNGYQILS